MSLQDMKNRKKYETEGKIPPPPVIRKTNWETFSKCLNVENNLYNFWSQETIETEAKALTLIINKALNKSSYEIKLRPKGAKFWSNDLHKQRMEVIKLERISKIKKTAEAFEAYKAAKNAYTKAIRKSKRRSWQSFCNEINDSKNFANLNRIIQRSKREKIGLMKKPDNTYTCDINESISASQCLSNHLLVFQAGK